MKKFLVPSPGRILLKEYKEEKKQGALLLPSEKGTKLYQVLNCCEGCVYEIDDIVCIKSYPTGLEIDNQIYYIIPQEDVLCHIEY